MNLYIGVTDNTWFNNLRYLNPDEVNFWQPGGKAHFRALQLGELFLFKLHSPHDYIAGGGFFAHNSIFPTSLAWQAFEQKNGANTYQEMRALISKHRHSTSSFKDYNIGCIILTQPFFWEEDKWLPVPADWKPNIVQGKTYGISSEIGKKLLEMGGQVWTLDNLSDSIIRIGLENKSIQLFREEDSCQNGKRLHNGCMEM